jgi:hypothetical protein
MGGGQGGTGGSGGRGGANGGETGSGGRLNGISDQALEMHFTLYGGYVKETNRLTEAIAALNPWIQASTPLSSSVSSSYRYRSDPVPSRSVAAPCPGHP